MVHTAKSDMLGTPERLYTFFSCYKLDGVLKDFVNITAKEYCDQKRMQ